MADVDREDLRNDGNDLGTMSHLYNLYADWGGGALVAWSRETDGAQGTPIT